MLGSVFLSCKATVENAFGCRSYPGRIRNTDVAFVLEGFEIGAGIGDQSALHAEIADGALELRDVASSEALVAATSF